MLNKLLNRLLRWTLPEKPAPVRQTLPAIICPRMLGIICTAELKSKRPYHFVTSVKVDIVETCPGEIITDIHIECNNVLQYNLISEMRMYLLEHIGAEYGMYRIVSDEQYDEMRLGFNG